MNNQEIFDNICRLSSKIVTQKYSTSFSWASKLFKPEIRQHIYNIYGFVRFADEIVDTFHQYDKVELMNRFECEYRRAVVTGISLNPIINSFCKTQREKKIPQDLVDAFLYSMKMDLGEIKNLTDKTYDEYIYGSAEVVGLMCLKVFLNGDVTQYEHLKAYAQSLGAAFQKINFLRDISADFNDLGRTYFPHVNFLNFTKADKIAIEKDIASDFAKALIGIKQLPISSRIAVYMAFKYYMNLFYKIKSCEPEVLVTKRMRVSNLKKIFLFSEMFFYKNLNSIR